MKSKSMNSPTFSFFKIVLTILDPLHFSMNFRISLSMFCKKGHQHSNRDCSELWCILRSIVITTILSSSPFILFFNFFQQCFVIYTVKYIYLLLSSILLSILFIHSIIDYFLISCLDYSLLGCRNIVDFCWWMFYSAVSSNLLF